MSERTFEDSEAFVEFYLAHGFYDPRKAHEYYMRTRKLVGRKLKVKNETETIKDFDGKGSNVTYTKKRIPFLPDYDTVKITKPANTDNSARIKAIHDKLDRLDREADKLPVEKKKKAKSRIQKIRGKLSKLHNPFGVQSSSKIITGDHGVPSRAVYGPRG